MGPNLLKEFRHRLSRERDVLLESLAELRPNSSRGELLSSELIPLLDACKFLEVEVPKILAPQKLGKRGQPAWLWGVETIIYREPLGRVLILAPGNYPLFLPIVQALQAWAAGNEVWLKSAPGSLALHQRVREIFLASGGSEAQFKLLGEEVGQFDQALAQVQKIVLVGSAETGRTVLSKAGKALVPVIAELSGWDAVFVHPEADMKVVAQSIAFGLNLNNGRTCVAPRRIFLRGRPDLFEQHYQEAVALRPTAALSEIESREVEMAEKNGARYLSGAPAQGPGVLSRVSSQHRLLREDLFGALAVLCVVETDEEALSIAKECPYALGASLFGPEDWAQELAHKVPAQVVSINDTIVPTADPRVPFGGSGTSGYGRMRGAEGLLEMTQTRSVSVRRGGGMDHLLPPGPLDELIVEQFLLMSHSKTLGQRAKAFFDLTLGIAKERIRKRRAARKENSRN